MACFLRDISNSLYSFNLDLVSIFPCFGTGNRRFQAFHYSISSCIETGSGYRYCFHYRETQSGKSRLIAEFGLYGELLARHGLDGGLGSDARLCLRVGVMQLVQEIDEISTTVPSPTTRPMHVARSHAYHQGNRAMACVFLVPADSDILAGTGGRSGPCYRSSECRDFVVRDRGHRRRTDLLCLLSLASVLRWENELGPARDIDFDIVSVGL